ncbi:MAG: cell division protein SepF [Clostridia bacterium]|nr:cell division protein SepF [Clostridia bacterium]
MAFRDIARGVKNFFGPNNRFFNGSREDDPAEDYYPQQSVPAAPVYGQEAQQQAPQYQQPQYQQQPVYQQAPQQYQQNYQQPQPQPHPVQYRTQAGYQQPMQPQGYGMDQQTVNQAYVQPRNRRSAQHAQAVENVVQFPVTPEQPQQPAEQPAAKKQISACVINVRSIADCRSAIGILRTGDCVIAVMDSIADQAEVRRYVDTLNGACFSLGCTMTRTSSRVGVYFLAPVGMQVLTDQTTTQMNSQSRAPQRARSAQPVFQNPYQAPQQSAYTPRPTYQPGYQQPYAAAPQQPVYQQPSFSAQQPAQGYTPDQEAADAVM